MTRAAARPALVLRDYSSKTTLSASSTKEANMPVRWRVDRGFSIGAGQTQYWNWNFFTDHAQGTGPNQGPIVFRAVPKGLSQGGNNTARNVLVTYDFAMCRGGPGDDHAPEVFCEFQIRNESTVDVPFNLEFILFSDLPINQ